MKNAEMPIILTLCGSTRFDREFAQATGDATLAGKIVLAPGFIKEGGITPEQKTALDALHCKKIEMSDEVLIIDVNGYIGESTAREIAYAKSLGKPVQYWSEMRAP